MKKNNMVAMILAGGRGSRLFDLTTTNAKPAVHYGGRYHIIDFPLSNCANSNISTVGVLLQYESVELGSYVTREHTWGLDMNGGGIYALSPREKDETGLGLYDGTADAIYQNRDFLDQEEAEYVLVLSGDHIYKMDYADMLEYHIKKGADCTIATLEVTYEEASRFGIMNTNKDMVIEEFEEKPKVPKNNQASMGIYIFKTEKLIKYLEEDAVVESAHDFGKNIIPNMLNAKELMVAYPFKGYWKDVGTIESLWQANMDLIGDNPKFDIFNPYWKIHSRTLGTTPQYIGKEAIVENSLVSGGCKIMGVVENSVIGSNVVVEQGAVVRNSVIFNNVKIRKNAEINYVILDEDVEVLEGAKVGDATATSKEITVIGRGYKVEKAQVIGKGLNIEKEAK